ncbi:DUF5709 domain-containing protein [Streptomyces sp. NBC_01754]|uniref:DUF5709 domain-containing protein n=1 Tax=Streptomyces sp. NBC_01754 TaxID=2975930 RepID=UPI002DD7B762|nr:DUF5709 domain-containing protein [Streptomyces sp. NBC_01754]WSC96294.1 DUF5709 domain-containing protein [Streptomyces sp. NBC_01754]
MTDADRGAYPVTGYAPGAHEWGDEVYQPQLDQAADAGEQLDAEDMLDDSGLADLLDRGYSPPERPPAVDDRGTTASEQHSGESLDERLTREVPEISVAGEDGPGDLAGGDGELYDTEVGTDRAGRLTQEGDGHVPATLTAQDVGIDGAAASAEEAAMHVVPEAADSPVQERAPWTSWPNVPRGAPGTGTR